MALKELIPWRRRGEMSSFGEEINHLQREINRMFESVLGDGRRWPLSMPSFRGIGDFAPNVEIAESENTIEVSAELPGMKEKDLDVSLSADGTMLTLRGEKHQEKERKTENLYQSERIYGMFRRDLQLPAPVKAEGTEATFVNGVLTIRLPRAKEEAAGVTHIKVKPTAAS
jgi:HSP20 family protein